MESAQFSLTPHNIPPKIMQYIPALIRLYYYKGTKTRATDLVLIEMEIRASKPEKFAEELYFLMMSSMMRERVKSLGAKYGFSSKALREQILSVGSSVAERIEVSMQDTVYYQMKEAV